MSLGFCRLARRTDVESGAAFETTCCMSWLGQARPVGGVVCFLVLIVVSRADSYEALCRAWSLERWLESGVLGALLMGPLAQRTEL